jgi:hypothetical protein
MSGLAIAVGFIISLVWRWSARRKRIRTKQIDPSAWTGLPSHHPRERSVEWIATGIGKAVALVIVAYGFTSFTCGHRTFMRRSTWRQVYTTMPVCSDPSETVKRFERRG